MNALITALSHVPPTAAYGIVVLAVLAESVLLIGAFVPTLTLLLTVSRTGPHRAARPSAADRDRRVRGGRR